ncbi:hypothetical protein B0H14DRAFT_2956411, partial [Mycena olivaceomarginata]
MVIARCRRVVMWGCVVSMPFRAARSSRSVGRAGKGCVHSCAEKTVGSGSDPAVHPVSDPPRMGQATLDGLSMSKRDALGDDTGTTRITDEVCSFHTSAALHPGAAGTSRLSSPGRGAHILDRTLGFPIDLAAQLPFPHPDRPCRS